MKVLAIDDKEIDIKGVKNHCIKNNWSFESKTFKDDYIHTFMEFDADVIVLDWYDDAADDNDVGIKILRGFWENGYRPTVVFSAHSDSIDLPDEMKKSNLVKMFVKDPDGEEALIQYLEDNVKYFKALSGFRKEVGKVILHSFNVIEPLKTIADDFVGDEVLNYILAKRIVSALNIENKEIDMPEWGMYIYPPVSYSILTGDLLRLKDSDASKAENYKVVISQSCDIVHKKLKELACLNCQSMKSGIINDIKCEISHSLINVADLNQEQRKNAEPFLIQHKLANVMNAGFYNRWGVLPGLKGVCPNLSVDLKRIELISIDNIANSDEEAEGKEYIRVASLDSQYVGQLVWGYMQNACRPGATDRDVEGWAKRALLES